MSGVFSGVLLRVGVVLAALALAGCDYLPFGYTPIEEITAAPASFEGKEVKVKGTAGDLLQLGGLKAFNLKDGTGEIIVLAAGTLPAAKSQVALKGTVKSAVIIGGVSVGLRIEEIKRL